MDVSSRAEEGCSVFRLPTHSLCRRRPGVILLVVVVLLTLFATLGVAFVLYAESAAAAARLGRDAEVQDRPDVPPQVALNYFLGQLLYDAADNDPGVYSALRGHSLARLLYGYNDDSPTDNAQPFNGVGRLHGRSPFANTDDATLINYTYFPADGFLRDPERLGWRRDPARPRGPYTGGVNVPYTYPDLNNVFLAAVKADGTVLAHSFHRDWAGFGSPDPNNANWYIPGTAVASYPPGAGSPSPRPWPPTDPHLKYLVLRPRPVDQLLATDRLPPGQLWPPINRSNYFPPPEDAGGDVKNLIGGPGGNDSVWIDLNFPVLVTPGGLKYKALFAPLIVDLDNRINLNVHGNVRGHDTQGNPTQASNQGWGPWEVSLQQVLDPQSNNPGEWPRLFVGSTAPPLPGRYGGPPLGWLPGPALPPNNVAAAFPPAHFYAQVDYDGCDERNGYRASKAPQLPSGGPANCFPTFAGGYGNGSAAERTDHPLLFNVFQPAGDDRTFAASQMEALLRYGDTGSPALTSALLRLCPASFAAARTRGLVTTHSFDRVSPGAVSWLYNPALSGYAVAAGDEVPSGPAVSFPALKLRPLPPPPGSDFRADWRAGVGLQRVDLNRPLPPFPNQRTGTVPPYGPAPVGPFDRFDDPAAADLFLEALFERQRLADQVYRTLLLVTGVPPAARPAAPTDAELQPRRWLAQLAANLVDFVDDDDIPTPFNFYTEQDAYPDGRPAGAPPFDVGAVGGDPELPRYWVFGVELPHVVLNEVLAEYQVAPAPAPAGASDVRLWVELHNPFQVPPAGRGLDGRDGLPVPLQVPALPPKTSLSASGNNAAFAPYQVVIANQILPRPGNDNVLGKPDQVLCATTDADFTAPAPTVGGRPQAPPPPGVPAPYIDLRGGRTGNAFFLLGPPGSEVNDAIAAPPRGTVPASTPYVQTANLSYRVPAAAGAVTVLLRRLANPHLPFDPRPSLTLSDGEVSANPWYNPYLTVDYLDQVSPHNAADATIASRGKKQPYAAHNSQVADQTGKGPTRHTFGRPNNPGPDGGRADWLVHLDRQPVNPMELLQVAACQPYQLTQRFITDTKRFNHLAPWFDESHRLYRLFELLETPDRTAGTAGKSGRVAGKVNLNTVWDSETLLALCDPQSANSFTASDVTAIFSQLQTLRTPNGSPGANDRPFLSLATGVTPQGDTQYPRGTGIEDTLLRSYDGAGGDRRLFQLSDSSLHPYLRDQLLTKLFGNVSTRSNVFAVWLTVGFFEVIDDTSRPVKLGAEVGRAEMRHVRHRLFAIVDRSVISPNPRPVSGFDSRREPALLFVSVIQ
jgi:hypothetical protein